MTGLPSPKQLLSRARAPKAKNAGGTRRVPRCVMTNGPPSSETTRVRGHPATRLPPSPTLLTAYRVSRRQVPQQLGERPAAAMAALSRCSRGGLCLVLGAIVAILGPQAGRIHARVRAGVGGKILSLWTRTASVQSRKSSRRGRFSSAVERRDRMSKVSVRRRTGQRCHSDHAKRKDDIHSGRYTCLMVFPAR